MEDNVRGCFFGVCWMVFKSLVAWLESFQWFGRFRKPSQQTKQLYISFLIFSWAFLPKNLKKYRESFIFCFFVWIGMDPNIMKIKWKRWNAVSETLAFSCSEIWLSYLALLTFWLGLAWRGYIPTAWFLDSFAAKLKLYGKSSPSIYFSLMSICLIKEYSRIQKM